MSFQIAGLPVETFRPLFGLSDEALAERGVIRRTADAKPGFPCRITLRDAEPGDTLLLLNHESHSVATPYRSAYAIYVNEDATETRHEIDAVPEVLRHRPLALRIFNAEGMLIGADLTPGEMLEGAIAQAFANPEAAYIHAHNAAHGCFAAKIDRA